jgi:probable HAF family extracellular repeat protein
MKAIRLGRRAVLAAVAVAMLAVPGVASAQSSHTASLPTAQSADRCPGNCVFIVDRGRFTTVELPFDQLQDFVRFNNRGEIVGGYVPADPPNDAVAYRGYLRDRRGTTTLIDFPGAIATLPQDISDAGQIVGKYSRTPTGETRGFLRDRRGRYRTIHPPGAVRSQAFGINNRGQVVGEFLDAAGTFHGFLWTEGRFTVLDRPGSAGTSATDVNDRGHVVGLSVDQAGSYRGFLLARGRYRGFDVPFGQQFLFPPAVNNRDQIVGTAFTLADGALVESHGFVLRNGVAGPFGQIDVPGADLTGAFGITDRGSIIGLYGEAMVRGA